MEAPTDLQERERDDREGYRINTSQDTTPTPLDQFSKLDYSTLSESRNGRSRKKKKNKKLVKIDISENVSRFVLQSCSLRCNRASKRKNALNKP